MWVVRCMLLVASLSGCSQVFGLHDIGPFDDAGSDGARDGRGDGPRLDGDDSRTGDGPPLTDGRLPPDCLGSGHRIVCWTGPLTDVTLGSMGSASSPLDTDTDSHCSSNASWLGGGPPACFVVGLSVIIVNATSLATYGSRVLVLASTSTITVKGDLDASSHDAGSNGPGANPSQCGTGTTPSSAGGGAGGSFMTAGGNGGSDGPIGGGVAAAALTAAPAELQGGCAGQAGVSPSGSPVGTGGAGGGAVYLVAADGIALNSAAITASGAGGGSSTVSVGACGGGAGGSIVLYAPSITASSAVLAANGGGGGGARSSMIASTDGKDPMGAMVGSGGLGGANGGSGAATTAATAGQSSTGNGAAGAGGGGGGGYVYANVSISGAVTVSPQLSM